MLARAMTRPSNLLVLDEPTNDLDLDTLDLLQEMLADYAGTVLLVSHDRDFLDRVVTSVVNYEGNGRWQEYAGGFSDMVAQRGKGLEQVARASAPEKKAAPKPAKEAPKPAAKARMTYKDKHALETLPAKMAGLQQQIAALEKTLADAGLFTRDPDAFSKASDALAQKSAALSEAEDEWLRLEILREELDSA